MSRKPLAERVLAAAEQARDHAAGRRMLKERSPQIPKSINVARIRAQTKLSQSAFAKRIGVSAATLKNWEQGHRKPTGPALVLLALLKKDPQIVETMLVAGS